jgi:translation initiation factor 3 subunit A
MASSAFFYKPELALRRALELSGIQQHEAALSLLHEILSGPRRQRTWSPAFEQIMMAYLDLCLKLFKTREAKDGLHQYRNLSQSQAPGSLEKVIRHLMDKALAQCQKAQAAVDQATLAQTTDTEDELGATPEAILLSTMAMDPAKSQRDSALLLPTLKFLWETYRAILDILRSSSKLEHVYHAAAQQALLFCQTYNRRVEFRHLTDMLRTHLGNLRQYGSVTAENDESRSNHKVCTRKGPSHENNGCGKCSTNDRNHSFFPLLVCFLLLLGSWLGRLDNRIHRVALADTLLSAGDGLRLAPLYGRLSHLRRYL